MLYMLNTRYWHPAFKTLVAVAGTIMLGYMLGVYVTYPDLVTASYVGTALLYAATIVLVRKVLL